jgi:Holliday junction resolvase
MGKAEREKGGRVEREIVNLHKHIGIRSERYPLSGSSRFRGSGHDIDLYIWGDTEAPAVCEVKARKSGSGFSVIERWLGEFDALFLKRNNAQPLVVLPWRTWQRLIEQVTR